MKSKKMFSIILFIIGILLIIGGIVVSFEKNNTTTGEDKLDKNDNYNVIVIDDIKYTYKIDVPYYGNITIGSKTFDMLSTDDELDKLDIDNCFMYVNCYEDEDTDDKFEYEIWDWDDSYEVNFSTYNDTYLQYGCEDCDIVLSEYIKLPKGITYNSSIDDVIKAYGQPKEQEEYEDDNYMYNDSIDGEKFGKFSSTRLKYTYKKDKVVFNLELFFDIEDDILYRVDYYIKVSKK